MKVGFVIPGLCNSEVFLIPEATYEFLPGANPIELQGKKQITIARDKRLVSILYPTITDRSGMGLAAAKASSNKLPLKSSHVECLAYILEVARNLKASYPASLVVFTISKNRT